MELRFAILGSHGFECRAVAFAAARHHRRGSAVKHSLVRNSRGGNRPSKFEVRQHPLKQKQADTLVFFVCMQTADLYAKAAHKQKKETSYDVSS